MVFLNAKIEYLYIKYVCHLPVPVINQILQMSKYDKQINIRFYHLSQTYKLGLMMHRICVNAVCVILQPQRQEGCYKEGDRVSLILYVYECRGT